MTRSLILLSGGLDSAVNLALAREETKIEMALTFDYGQICAKKEIEASSMIARHYEIPFQTLEIPWLGKITKTALCNKEAGLPTFDKDLPQGSETMRELASKVWVPNRNGLFINIAASYAESLDLDMIVTGFNKEEGETFPDNSRAFIDAINDSLSYSTLKGCRVRSYTWGMMKKDIVKIGMKYNVPFNLIYSCYKGEEKMCGRCESCLRVIRAFKENGCLELIRRNFA